jgi:alpha-glucoside transport system substrate-binding protein
MAKQFSSRRTTASVACVAALALVLTSCGGNDDDDDTAGGAATTTAAGTTSPAASPTGDASPSPTGDASASPTGDASASPTATGAAPGGDKCAPYAAYGDLKGKKVTAYSPIREKEADLLEESWKDFQECTGVDIAHEGSGEFEAQLQVRVEGGNAPDLAFFPQPGLLASQAKNLKPAPAAVEKAVDENWSKDWKAYGTVDGKFYAAPLMASMKSLVWYSPKMFTEKGYTVPKTWDEMIALSDKMAGEDMKPWCAGIESQDATGWVATDWLEDVMLREVGPEVYDKWQKHEIPFNDPQVAKALDRVGSILKNDKYVNGGYGDVKSIASTAFQDGGLPILEGECGLHRQASFYLANWPKEAKVAEDGDIFAFYLPPIDPAKGNPVLGAGEFVGAFADRPEVQAVQAYLASGEWANSRVKLGGNISANKKLDIANAQTPIDKLAVQTLQDPETVFRFDASDLMPAKVGQGTFWKGMTDWINGKSTKEVLDQIERSYS